jgi:hypothetical protein
MVAAPVLSAYWKKSATNSSRAALTSDWHEMFLV